MISTPELPFRVKAKYFWGDDTAGDLGFIDGDIILVDSLGDGRWWHGTLHRNNMSGNFPSNFVEILDDGISKTDEQKNEFNDGHNATTNVVNRSSHHHHSHPSSANSSKSNIDTSRIEKSLASKENTAECSNHINNHTVLPESLTKNTLPSHEQHYKHMKQIQKIKQMQKFLDDGSYKENSGINNNNNIKSSHSLQSIPKISSSKIIPHSLSASILSSSQTPCSANTSVNTKTSLPVSSSLTSMAHMTFFDQPSFRKDRDCSNSSTLKPENTTIHEVEFDTRSDISSEESLSSPPPPLPHKIPISNSSSNISRWDNPEITDVEYNNDHHIKHQNFENQHTHNLHLSPYNQGNFNRSQTSLNGSSEVTDDNHYNSTASVASSISTAITDFSATSAGSYYRHKQQQKKEQVIQHQEEVPVVYVAQEKKRKNLKFLKKLFNKDNDDNEPLSTYNDMGRDFNALNSSSHPSFRGTLPKEESLLSGIGILSTVAETFLKSVNNKLEMDRQNFDEKKLYVNEESWLENKIDLARLKTISDDEYKTRQKRLSTTMILKPQKLVSDNFNEVQREIELKLNVDQINLKHVDDFVRNLKNLGYVSPTPFVINDIAINFETDIERIRACYIFCTEKIHLIELNEQIDTRNTPAKYINSIFQKRSATAYELAWLMKVFLEALNIKNELVIGCFKKPNEESNNITTNHVWNSVLINDEWRFIDCSLANINSYFNPILKDNNNVASPTAICEANYDKSIYFLTEPLHLIHTHIPRLIQQQHIIPALDSMVAFSLLQCYPQFFKNDLKIKKFNNALTRMEDFEIFEMLVQVPENVELFGSIKFPSNVTDLDLTYNPNIQKKSNTFTGTIRNSTIAKNKNNSAAAIAITKTNGNTNNNYRNLVLTQVYWHKNNKYYRIKASLPSKHEKGILEIYSGIKGTQKTITNIHPLAMCIPLYRTISEKMQKMQVEKLIYRELYFVTRYPTIHCQMSDIYVQEPQVYNLVLGSLCGFKFSQHISSSFKNDNTVEQQQKPKLTLQSPSGRIIKLRKKQIPKNNTQMIDQDEGLGEWETQMACNEVGVWKALIGTDVGIGMCVFAEWYCK